LKLIMRIFSLHKGQLQARQVLASLLCILALGFQSFAYAFNSSSMIHISNSHEIVAQKDISSGDVNEMDMSGHCDSMNEMNDPSSVQTSTANDKSCCADQCSCVMSCTVTAFPHSISLKATFSSLIYSSEVASDFISAVASSLYRPPIFA